MATRVGLFAGGTARDPNADGLRFGVVLEDGGEDAGLQSIEDGRVAEKAGDVDEHVLIKGFELGRVLLDDT